MGGSRWANYNGHLISDFRVRSDLVNKERIESRDYMVAHLVVEE